MLLKRCDSIAAIINYSSEPLVLVKNVKVAKVSRYVEYKFFLGVRFQDEIKHTIVLSK